MDLSTGLPSTFSPSSPTLAARDAVLSANPELKEYIQQLFVLEGCYKTLYDLQDFRQASVAHYSCADTYTWAEFLITQAITPNGDLRPVQFVDLQNCEVDVSVEFYVLKVEGLG